MCGSGAVRVGGFEGGWGGQKRVLYGGSVGRSLNDDRPSSLRKGVDTGDGVRIEGRREYSKRCEIAVFRSRASVELRRHCVGRGSLAMESEWG
jgi:hypothetical protein